MSLNDSKSWSSLSGRRDVRTANAVYIPDIVAKQGDNVMVLDVRIVGLRTSLSHAHSVKKQKYSFSDLSALISPRQQPDVYSITLSYRGC